MTIELTVIREPTACIDEVVVVRNGEVLAGNQEVGL